MWKPKYTDLHRKAIKIYNEYKIDTNNGIKSSESIEKLGVKYDMNSRSIYRYLNYAEFYLLKNAK
jgi:hypothetical protein